MRKQKQNVYISAGDSRDVFGRGRIFPITPEDQLMLGGNRPELLVLEEHIVSICSSKYVS
jgi:hypothetical protein